MTELIVRVELDECPNRCRAIVRRLMTIMHVLSRHLVPGAWIVLGVLRGRSLVIVNRGGVVGVSPHGVLEAGDAERRDAVHGDKKLKIDGGELELWWCV